MAKEKDKNGIAVDAMFTFFEELEEEITKYRRENYVQFYRRDSWTVDAALRRAVQIESLIPVAIK